MGDTIKSFFGAKSSAERASGRAQDRAADVQRRQEARISKQEATEQKKLDSRRAVISAQSGGGQTLNPKTGFSGVKAKLGA